MWVKVEIIAERMYHQFDYQRIVNHLTDKDLKELKDQVAEIKRQQEKQRLSSVSMLRDSPTRENTLNSEEMVYSSLLIYREEVTEDDYEDSEYDPLESLQELSDSRTKL